MSFLKQELFDFFVNNHNLNLLDGEMQDIINFVHKNYPDENFCEPCNIAENMRKMVYLVSNGMMSYANYTYEAMANAYSEQLKELVEAETKELQELCDNKDLENDELQDELAKVKTELDGYKELLMKMAGKTIYIQNDEDIPAIFKDLKDEQIRLLKEEINFLKESRCPHCEPRQCFNHDKTPVEVYIKPFCRIKNEHQKRGDALNKIILSSPKFNIDACQTLTATEIELKASSLYATHIEDIRQMAICALGGSVE